MSSWVSAFKQVFRAVRIFSSLFATRGSYLIRATAAADATVYVENTSDFAVGGGSGQIIDTLNDRDNFTYAGKTAKTLTGCVGILAHNNGATIIPMAKCIVIDDNVNEMRFFGNRGDGVVEELSSIGLKPVGVDVYVAFFGSQNVGSSRIAVVAQSDSSHAIVASSNSGTGVRGITDSSYGVHCVTNAVNKGAPFKITALNAGIAIPSHVSDFGSIWETTEGYLYINIDGTATGWRALGPLFSIQTDVTVARAFGTVYQNTTGRPIMISVSGSTSIANILSAKTDNANPPTTIVNQINNGTTVCSVFFVVLPNNYYLVDFAGGVKTLSKWVEWS